MVKQPKTTKIWPGCGARGVQVAAYRSIRMGATTPEFSGFVPLGTIEIVDSTYIGNCESKRPRRTPRNNDYWAPYCMECSKRLGFIW